jgi:hypothetical protein
MASNYPQPASLCEIAGESGKLVFGEGKVTGTRVAEVSWAEMLDAVKYFLGAVVIAPDGVEIIYSGDAWPGIPNLTAQSVDVEPRGKTGNSEWSEAIIPATRARLRIAYDTSRGGLQTGGSNGGPEDEVYLVESVDYSCEVLTIPVKVVDSGKEREAKRHFRIPTITYIAELPKVLRPSWSTIQDLSGKINSVAVFGGAVGTVLFDGPKLNRTIDQSGNFSWHAVYKFVYNKFGWNNQLHPDTLEWVAATAVSGANTIYESADLSALWNKSRV